MTAIMPTGVKKPKQKASVEGSVGKIATAVIAKLRNEIFTSLESLNSAIRKAVENLNHQKELEKFKETNKTTGIVRGADYYG